MQAMELEYMMKFQITAILTGNKAMKKRPPML